MQQYSRQEPQQAQRKAKPATNPDVHQTRQDCNCVLAIRMQRYTMYYYVVVMLLCYCKWPLLLYTAAPKSALGKKKKCSRQITSDNILPFFFMTKSIFGGAKDIFFSSFLPFSRKHQYSTFYGTLTRAHSRFKVFFFAAQILHIHNMYGAIWAQRNISFKKWNFKKAQIYHERGQDSFNWINPE